MCSAGTHVESKSCCLPSFFFSALGVTTHVLVTNAKGLKAKDGRAIADRRTQKYMCAVLHGTWVVTTEWVYACVSAKHILTGLQPSAHDTIIGVRSGASKSCQEESHHLEEPFEVRWEHSWNAGLQTLFSAFQASLYFKIMPFFILCRFLQIPKHWNATSLAAAD